VAAASRAASRTPQGHSGKPGPDVGAELTALVYPNTAVGKVAATPRGPSEQTKAHAPVRSRAHAKQPSPALAHDGCTRRTQRRRRISDDHHQKDPPTHPSRNCIALVSWIRYSTGDYAPYGGSSTTPSNKGPRGTCFTVCGRPTAVGHVGHPGAVRSRL
jgi:hypothetical protein